ncbi:hypothetical protein GH714_014861 [Hevea brasiliensis]|uniref:Uncharacterized protein n=1 Tax=Hevea brasiliensis TaxID=3981 RepID=A0A6A6NH71_HEVBR|nr:hypothetical protein GH714_014861 [Hevea brasiliensis]
MVSSQTSNPLQQKRPDKRPMNDPDPPPQMTIQSTQEGYSSSCSSSSNSKVFDSNSEANLADITKILIMEPIGTTQYSSAQVGIEVPIVTLFNCLHDMTNQRYVWWHFLEWFQSITDWHHDLEKTILDNNLNKRSPECAKEIRSLLILHRPFFRNPEDML